MRDSRRARDASNVCQKGGARHLRGEWGGDLEQRVWGSSLGRAVRPSRSPGQRVAAAKSRTCPREGSMCGNRMHAAAAALDKRARSGLQLVHAQAVPGHLLSCVRGGIRAGHSATLDCVHCLLRRSSAVAGPPRLRCTRRGVRYVYACMHVVLS